MAANGGILDVEELWHLSSYSGRGKGENGKLDSAHHHSNTDSCCSVAMTTEECPVPLGMSQVGARRFEDFGSSQGDDNIEEVGPCDDALSDLSTLVVPFPELAPVVFFCLKQTTCPRNLCIRMDRHPGGRMPAKAPSKRLGQCAIYLFFLPKHMAKKIDTSPTFLLTQTLVKNRHSIHH
ncbi:Voltage-dependent T-type calcium channel subunit alpha-1I [Triplophysa tibetana]|uniref:Voltage-dependent T-type calcium channel subunit alpha-1I n=1 Tax=Triplophysa tibetana TaxID=1572043 RepID=A0A5A9NBM8_9TELE|nr:Voltage-dependent T-type calcium channel subunit alpha-1I [Triplophysa tibetana]